jgi:hypothetical protein
MALDRMLLSLTLAASLSACGGNLYQPSRAAGFRFDDPREIDDDDIAKAFLASPQMPAEVRVAFYVFDESHAEEAEAMLRDVSGVASTYRIPSLLVNGKRKFDPAPSPYAPPPAEPIRLEQLRLLAARARADVLVVVDYGYEVRRQPNPWAATGIVLFPLLFTPWLDVEVESYLDSYVVDVRNGFLYGHISSDDAAEEGYVTIHSNAEKAMIEGQLSSLMEETKRLLTQLVADERTGQIAAGPVPDAG